jgi:hypothetical protein
MRRDKHTWRHIYLPNLTKLHLEQLNSEKLTPPDAVMNLYRSFNSASVSGHSLLEAIPTYKAKMARAFGFPNCIIE